MLQSQPPRGNAAQIRTERRLKDIQMGESIPPALQQLSARVLASGHLCRHHGPPEGPGEPVVRLPAEEVQEQQWLAEAVGRVYQLLSLFLQNLPR